MSPRRTEEGLRAASAAPWAAPAAPAQPSGWPRPPLAGAARACPMAAAAPPSPPLQAGDWLRAGRCPSSLPRRALGPPPGGACAVRRRSRAQRRVRVALRAGRGCRDVPRKHRWPSFTGSPHCVARLARCTAGVRRPASGRASPRPLPPPGCRLRGYRVPSGSAAAAPPASQTPQQQQRSC